MSVLKSDICSYVEEEPLMGLRQYQQSGLQYQYSGQYNVPGGQAAGWDHDLDDFDDFDDHDDDDDDDDDDDNFDDKDDHDDIIMMMTVMMMMTMTGGSRKVERGSELRHIFSPGPNSNQQMVRILMMLMVM